MDGSLVSGRWSGNLVTKALRVPDVVEVQNNECEVLTYPHSIDAHLLQDLVRTQTKERLEIVCPKDRLNAVIDAVQKILPYEEVVFDVYSLLTFQ